MKVVLKNFHGTATIPSKQGRRHIFLVGGTGLHGRIRTQKRPKVNTPKTKISSELGLSFWKEAHFTN